MTFSRSNDRRLGAFSQRLSLGIEGHVGVRVIGVYWLHGVVERLLLRSGSRGGTRLEIVPKLLLLELIDEIVDGGDSVFPSGGG